MNKTLLLLATLGSFGITPLIGPAAADDFGRSHFRTAPSFGVRILVHPAPKVVRHHRPGAWQLRPQPVFRFADPRPIRQFWHPAPRPLFGHLPPRPHLGHFPPRPHFGHLPSRPRFWYKVPHATWRQPWQRLPHHVVRPPHRDPSWRHGGRQWHSWPGRDFADRQWRDRPGRDFGHREWQKGSGRRHGGHGGRRH